MSDDHDDERRPLNPRQRRTAPKPDIYEQHTLYDRALEAQGRFAGVENVTRVIQGASSYPRLSGDNLWSSPQPDHGYAPDRDRIEPEHVTPPEFGIACGGAAIQPLESTPISSQATLAEDVEQPTAPSSANFRRGL